MNIEKQLKTITELEIWIEDTQFDLSSDWCENKGELSIQLQQLLIVKANLELISKNTTERIANSFLKSNIKK